MGVIDGGGRFPLQNKWIRWKQRDARTDNEGQGHLPRLTHIPNPLLCDDSNSLLAVHDLLARLFVPRVHLQDGAELLARLLRHAKHHHRHGVVVPDVEILGGILHDCTQPFKASLEVSFKLCYQGKLPPSLDVARRHFQHFVKGLPRKVVLPLTPMLEADFVLLFHRHR